MFTYLVTNPGGQAELDIQRVRQGWRGQHRPQRAQGDRARPLLSGGHQGAGRDPRQPLPGHFNRASNVGLRRFHNRGEGP